ncbi:MAG: hypothetical protein J7619_00045 [Dyadobacter sp.]|uniref:hypothetical protein n=1 Tax=Dyadobacter sp. TaxID=1914288 RepID=UPI001B135435|nr:hypothetical protein [Dyadobacter sp.]MBO9611047.1 hypothetical protein [Dyadobacter sp.]
MSKRNVARPIGKAYFDLLNNMVIEGHTVPFVHMRAAYSKSKPFIRLLSLTAFDENTKDAFDCTATVDLEVHTSFPGDFGNMDLADAIADELFARVMPEPGKSGIQAPGLNIISAKMLEMRDRDEWNGKESKYQKFITIEHIVFQK